MAARENMENMHCLASTFVKKLCVYILLCVYDNNASLIVFLFRPEATSIEYCAGRSVFSDRLAHLAPRRT